jgi:hypothetical protein
VVSVAHPTGAGILIFSIAVTTSCIPSSVAGLITSHATLVMLLSVLRAQPLVTLTS